MLISNYSNLLKLSNVQIKMNIHITLVVSHKAKCVRQKLHTSRAYINNNNYASITSELP